MVEAEKQYQSDGIGSAHHPGNQQGGSQFLFSAEYEKVNPKQTNQDKINREDDIVDNHSSTILRVLQE